MAKTYEPIATYTIPSSTNSYTFTSIPTTYTDLILICSLGQVTTPNQGVMQVGNGSVDTGSNYSDTVLYGNGSAAGSTRTTSATSMLAGYTAAPETASNTYNVETHHFMNYSNTTTNKTVLHRASKASNGVDAVVSLWRSTAAINTIKYFVTGGGNLAAGSTLTLYGIKAA